MTTRRSAGILLYRRRGDSFEVLLGHPGGPFFGHADLGSWSIPKGEPGPDETDLETTARREFEEETGHRVPDGRLVDLGTVTQRGGKVVHAWAAEGDLDPATAQSNTFSFEWPPFSGKIRTYPELDKVEWYDPVGARRRIKAAQLPLIERLEAAVLGTPVRATPSVAVFDVGAVLIDWNPRYLYRRLVDDEAELERFLAEVCTPEWNASMDAGRPFAEGIEELVARHPAQVGLIRAYRERWVEMLGGPIEGTVSIVRELRAAGVRVFALSNWSAETYPLTRPLYPFLDELDGILISGEASVAKPDPAIYRLFLERFGLESREIVFVDDSAANVAAARALGIEAIRFEDALQTRRELIRFGFPLAPQP